MLGVLLHQFWQLEDRAKRRGAAYQGDRVLGGNGTGALCVTQDENVSRRKMETLRFQASKYAVVSRKERNGRAAIGDERPSTSSALGARRPRIW